MAYKHVNFSLNSTLLISNDEIEGHATKLGLCCGVPCTFLKSQCGLVEVQSEGCIL